MTGTVPGTATGDASSAASGTVSGGASGSASAGASSRRRNEASRPRWPPRSSVRELLRPSQARHRTRHDRHLFRRRRAPRLRPHADLGDHRLSRPRADVPLGLSPAITRTRVAGGSTLPRPTVTSSAVRAPRVRSWAAAPASSSAALSPFIASSSPPSQSSGIDQASRRSSGATARAVATSKSRSWRAPRPALARPRRCPA